MALVVIHIHDKADGSVDVRLSNEPRIDGPRAKYTKAEELGAIVLNAIHAQLEEQIHNAKPALIIAGSDEMPH